VGNGCPAEVHEAGGRIYCYLGAYQEREHRLCILELTAYATQWDARWLDARFTLRGWRVKIERIGDQKRGRTRAHLLALVPVPERFAAFDVRDHMEHVWSGADRLEPFRRAADAQEYPT
jgi:hypothetical protein